MLRNCRRDGCSEMIGLFWWGIFALRRYEEFGFQTLLISL
ncbi:hypothetical protein CES85_3555 (plasmid) [Ochrobactrum quorumnocens]|uniref:Uncharacterized protein n=1 Tax=Ochrobactrum quorumnocens TaxID=271865 RepID=A0A248UNM8_9HYPH|nr:hypothetical protein CES85_3555 [[Ochrobactrum] quorumnocens]